MHKVSEWKSRTIFKLQFIGKRILDAALSTFIHHYRISGKPEPRFSP